MVAWKAVGSWQLAFSVLEGVTSRTENTLMPVTSVRISERAISHWENVTNTNREKAGDAYVGITLLGV